MTDQQKRQNEEAISESENVEVEESEVEEIDVDPDSSDDDYTGETPDAAEDSEDSKK